MLPLDILSIITYAAAHAAVTAAPGPVVAVVLSRTLADDLSGAVGFTAGVCIGKIVAIFSIALGLGAVAFDEWKFLFQLVGSFYLLWLAARMWQTAPVGLVVRSPQSGRVVATATGTAFSLGNPVTFIFYLMILPSVIPTGFNDPATLGTVILITVIVVGGVLTAVIFMARQFRRIFASPGAYVAFNRGMAMLLATTALSLLIF